MKKNSISFLIKLSVITIVLVLVMYGLLQVMSWPTPTYAIAIFAVLYIVTFLVFILQGMVMTKYPDFSLHVILGSLIIRLIIFAIFNFIMIYTDRDNAMANVILFFAIYIVFTAVEMITLFQQISQSKSTSQPG